MTYFGLERNIDGERVVQRIFSEEAYFYGNIENKRDSKWPGRRGHKSVQLYAFSVVCCCVAIGESGEYERMLRRKNVLRLDSFRKRHVVIVSCCRLIYFRLWTILFGFYNIF